MQTGVAGGVVEVEGAVVVGYPSVGEEDIGDVAHALVVGRGHEVAGRGGDDLGRVVERGHVGVEDVAEAGCAGADAMGKVEPSLGGLDGMGAFAVLHFLDGVVVAGVDDGFFLHFGMGDVVYQGPSDASAAACLDEVVLRTGVEGVFAVDKLGMEDDVALLAAALEVGEAVPGLEVLGTGNAGSGGGAGEVALRGAVVVALGTEDAVYPSVFVAVRRMS